MNPRLLLAIAAILMVAALVFVGCSGSGGPAMPSPATPDRPDPTPIVVEDLIIPADEERLVQEDTVFTVEGVVQIDGALIGADASGAGAHGVDITIEAEGDITVTGLVQAGSGTDGASDEAGGDGGSVSLTSTGGSITVGAEGGIAASSSGQSGVHAGDAGAGGDGLLGGPGGQGGSVLIQCAAGTLTMHPQSGLIHIGSGGHGGTGHIPEDYDGDTIDLSERDASGGHSGQLATKSQSLVGLDEQDGALVVEPADLITGGNGGNGGDMWMGVEVGAELPEHEAEATSSDIRPNTAGPRAASNVISSAEVERGSHGGNAVHPGQPGNGGLSSVYVNELPDSPPPPVSIGGDGGDLHFAFHEDADGNRLPRIVPQDSYVGGTGGAGVVDVHAGPARAGPCQDGRDGISPLTARGGHGGRVVEEGLPDLWLRNMTIVGGRGGRATAHGSAGQHGGGCCADPVGKGGDGGDGSPVVTARSGDGGHQVAGRGGDSDVAWATGGRGGDGGPGVPPGAGGSATAVLTAAAGDPGRGTPPGERGETWPRNGRDGIPGNPCPEAPAPEPGPTPDPGPEPEPEPRVPTGYGVSSSSTDDWFFVQQGWYSSAIGPRQSGSFTIGGDNHPVRPRYGNSIIVNRDSSKLWALDELSGIAMFSNPLTGGDRPADRVLGLETSWMASFWYEEVRDIAYAGSDVAGRVYAWDGASTGDPSRPPDRTLLIHGGQHGYAVRLTGAPGSDRLFVAVRDPVSRERVIMVFDRGHEAVGAAPPDRIIRPSERFSADAMAWDNVRDILYLGRSLDGREVDAYANASTLSGEVSPTRTFEIDYPDKAPDARIGCLVAASESDLLFVTVMNWLDYRGAIVAYSNASSVSGTPAPTRFEAYERAVMGLGIFREY